MAVTATTRNEGGQDGEHLSISSSKKSFIGSNAAFQQNSLQKIVINYVRDAHIFLAFETLDFGHSLGRGEGGSLCEGWRCKFLFKVNVGIVSSISKHSDKHVHIGKVPPLRLKYAQIKGIKML